MPTTPDAQMRPPETQLLRRVLEEANSLGRSGRLPFAALVTRGPDVLGTGVNTSEQTSDPLAHAEVEAIRDAATRHGDLADAIVVSSCEPCALCRISAIAAGITRIWYVTSKDLIPPDFGPPDPVTISLIDSVETVLPDLVHSGAGALQLSSDALAQPFREWLAVSRHVGTTSGGDR